MTKQEKVIVSAYTGVLMCDFADLQSTLKRIMGRPVWTHELAFHDIMQEIKAKSKEDFMNLCRN